MGLQVASQPKTAGFLARAALTKLVDNIVLISLPEPTVIRRARLHCRVAPLPIHLYTRFAKRIGTSFLKRRCDRNPRQSARSGSGTTARPRPAACRSAPVRFRACVLSAASSSVSVSLAGLPLFLCHSVVGVLIRRPENFVSSLKYTVNRSGVQILRDQAGPLASEFI
jgi:hypothetical protein